MVAMGVIASILGRLPLLKFQYVGKGKWGGGLGGVVSQPYDIYDNRRHDCWWPSFLPSLPWQWPYEAS